MNIDNPQVGAPIVTRMNPTKVPNTATTQLARMR
jgi:hypothetical protein